MWPSNKKPLCISNLYDVTSPHRWKVTACCCRATHWPAPSCPRASVPPRQGASLGPAQPSHMCNPEVTIETCPFLSPDRWFKHLSAFLRRSCGISPTACSRGQLRNKFLHWLSLLFCFTPCGRLNYWYRWCGIIHAGPRGRQTLLSYTDFSTWPHDLVWQLGYCRHDTSRNLKSALLCFRHSHEKKKNKPHLSAPSLVGPRIICTEQNCPNWPQQI